MARIASLHLVRERRWRWPLVLVRLATDRRRLRRVDGLAFWRLLGTGRGAETGPSVDLRRSALFAVWEDERDLDAFLARSTIARRWAVADEAWHVRLRGLGGHGSWHGVDVLDGLQRGDDDGVVAVLTRANVRVGAWVRFGRAGRPVSADLQDAVGLLGAVGIGEAPIGSLATFSLWRDRDDVRRFARSPRHADVVRRTRRERWYGEELFARFQPYAATGTWDGRNPLSSS
ncbi:MAG: spheroidene monooxygenase [Ilumatobacteraceae bacterium]